MRRNKSRRREEVDEKGKDNDDGNSRGRKAEDDENSETQ
jgi:hypothetical protein